MFLRFCHNIIQAFNSNSKLPKPETLESFTYTNHKPGNSYSTFTFESILQEVSSAPKASQVKTQYTGKSYCLQTLCLWPGCLELHPPLG